MLVDCILEQAMPFCLFHVFHKKYKFYLSLYGKTISNYLLLRFKEESHVWNNITN